MGVEGWKPLNGWKFFNNCLIIETFLQALFTGSTESIMSRPVLSVLSYGQKVSILLPYNGCKTSMEIDLF